MTYIRNVQKMLVEGFHLDQFARTESEDKQTPSKDDTQDPCERDMGYRPPAQPVCSSSACETRPGRTILTYLLEQCGTMTSDKEP
jgi:hypothetical protein